MHGTKTTIAAVAKTWKRVALVGAISTGTWIVFTLLTRPEYSFQLLSADMAYMAEALSLLIWDQHATHGVLGVLLPAMLAVLVGIIAVHTGVSLFQSYQASGSLSGALGGTIGFASAGCASCGAGVLSLIGLSGGVALLPFDGLGVQAASIAILLGTLEYTGRKNKVCSVDIS